MSSQSSKQLKKRTIDQEKWPHKTIDIGSNGITVSANPLGQIYQISAALEATNEFGIMVAAPWPQFDHLRRKDPGYVRWFRKIPETLLMKHHSGLGLDFEGQKGSVVVKHVKDSIGSHAQFEYLIRDSNLFVQTALKVHDHGAVVHASRITNMSNMEQMIQVTLDMAFAVSRAGYGQLTDRGTVEMPDPTNAFACLRGSNGAGVLAVDNGSLRGRIIAYITFYSRTAGQYIEVNHSLFAQGKAVQYPPHEPTERARQLLRMSPGETMILAVSFHPQNIPPPDPQNVSSPNPFANFSEDQGYGILSDAQFSHQDGEIDPSILVQRHTEQLYGNNPDSAETIQSKIFWANVNYILGCCCVPTPHSQGNGTCCVADHFALNLGWPRDNYWQMRLLRKLDWEKLEMLLPNNLDSASQYHGKIRHALGSHLFWLFQMATTNITIDGQVRHFWRRSYLVNGLPKDGEVFQLDTQCYPFLELCEYFDTYGHEDGVKNDIGFFLQTESFKNVLQDLLARRDNETGLFKSDETPADDDVGDYKFHLSSNILLWHTLRKLSGLLSPACFGSVAPPLVGQWHEPSQALKGQADSIKAAILQYFTGLQHLPTREGPVSTSILAYGFDPSKSLEDPTRHRFYHDGNDMPTLFAPEWGFLKSNDMDPYDDPQLISLWKNTMLWAFTPSNSGYQGKGQEKFHGLGSDHSQGPWTLGFFQEWKFAQIVGDTAKEQKAWKQIEGSAQFDGTFSEAVDISTGECTSKTWFSWPGAMIAENLIDVVIAQVWQPATSGDDAPAESCGRPSY
ncbi:hypothetical protein Daus18300_001742 [Diaporthe australafricana]|uniref:Uncharacterized protein n=1 Tax=Diaporthe australafricana TaxID=127596 RepID=A0ABR3XU98_9PEZI